MRQNKNEQGGALASFMKVWNSLDVVGKANSWKILDVLMLSVDNIGKVLHRTIFRLDLFFVHPHVHVRLTIPESRTVSSDHGGNGRSPVTGTDNAYFLGLIRACLRVGFHV